MNIIPIIIASALAIIIALSVWGFFGTGFLFSPPPSKVDTSLVENQNKAEKEAKTLVTRDESLGDYLTDLSGRTLYTTTREDCTGSCLEIWSPYLAKGSFYELEKLGVTIRDDLRMVQYTWDGEPLYYYQGDEVVGDTNGNELGGVWFIARP